MALGLVVLGGHSSFGADRLTFVPPAIEEDIEAYLSGCWNEVFPTEEVASMRERNNVGARSVCFQANGVVATLSVGGDKGGFVEAFGNSSTYDLSLNTIVFQYPGLSDGWTFGATDTTCGLEYLGPDLLMLTKCSSPGATRYSDHAKKYYEVEPRLVEQIRLIREGSNERGNPSDVQPTDLSAGVFM